MKSAFRANEGWAPGSPKRAGRFVGFAALLCPVPLSNAYAGRRGGTGRRVRSAGRTARRRGPKWLARCTRRLRRAVLAARVRMGNTRVKRLAAAQPAQPRGNSRVGAKRVELRVNAREGEPVRGTVCSLLQKCYGRVAHPERFFEEGAVIRIDVAAPGAGLELSADLPCCQDANSVAKAGSPASRMRRAHRASPQAGDEWHAEPHAQFTADRTSVGPGMALAVRTAHNSPIRPPAQR